jgi:hypothetical protein
MWPYPRQTPRSVAKVAWMGTLAVVMLNETASPRRLRGFAFSDANPELLGRRTERAQPVNVGAAVTGDGTAAGGTLGDVTVKSTNRLPTGSGHWTSNWAAPTCASAGTATGRRMPLSGRLALGRAPRGDRSHVWVDPASVVRAR